MKTFRIIIPPENQKREQAFLQLLYNLHESMLGRMLSFEIVVEAQHISFCFACAEKDSSLVSGQLYSVFPDAEIEEIHDPFMRVADAFQGGVLELERSDLFPIKTFEQFEGDSLSSLLSVLSKASIHETTIVQYLLRPKSDSGSLHFLRGWKRRMENIRHLFRIKYWFKKGNFRKTFREAFAKKESEKLFDTSVRLLVSSKNAAEVPLRFHAIAQGFSSFALTDFNRFQIRDRKSSAGFQKLMQQRKDGGGDLLSQSELATLYHLPNEREVPNLVYVLSKKSESPSTLPTEQGDPETSFFGETNFHGTRVPFGILRKDRRRHLYTLGKSGSGKSKLLELLIQNDILAGKGVGVLDPHGDLVDNILRFVPKERMQDVVLFDPGDEEFPIAFNPLEKVPSTLKMRVTIGFLEIFKKLFGSNWTNRLEHVLRYTVLALLDSPNTTVLSIMKMLTDKNYRQYIVKNIEDDVVKNFWVNEFAGWSEKFDAEAITPLLNKVGQFVATNMIRNIVGQPQNKIHFREIMDSGKILLMKVSKGMLGQENAGLLGAMAVTKIYQAAMSRADTPEEERKDFYFYVDEFQNFATDTFDEILSEARKYRLNITLANQFLGQLSPNIRTTVFGNVGSMVTFRVGAEDAEIFEGEFTPVFKKRDIINLGVRDFYCKMSINGETTQPFSGKTLDMRFPEENYAKEILSFSRRQYCLPKKDVEKVLQAWEEGKDVSAQAFAEIEFDSPIL